MHRLFVAKRYSHLIKSISYGKAKFYRIYQSI